VSTLSDFPQNLWVEPLSEVLSERTPGFGTQVSLENTDF